MEVFFSPLENWLWTLLLLELILDALDVVFRRSVAVKEER